MESFALLNLVAINHWLNHKSISGNVIFSEWSPPLCFINALDLTWMECGFCMRFPSTQNSNSNWIRIICECECVYTVAVASGDVMFSSTTCIDYMYDCMSCESNFVHETSIKRRKHICIQPKCVCIFATKNTFYQFYWFSGFDRISSKKKQTSAQTCFCFGFKPNQTKANIHDNWKRKRWTSHKMEMSHKTLFYDFN